ncbi:MAG: hypothetical protein AB7V55_06345, partial [Oscillospiraceae bacterium]
MQQDVRPAKAKPRQAGDVARPEQEAIRQLADEVEALLRRQMQGMDDASPAAQGRGDALRAKTTPTAAPGTQAPREKAPPAPAAAPPKSAVPLAAPAPAADSVHAGQATGEPVRGKASPGVSGPAPAKSDASAATVPLEKPAVPIEPTPEKKAPVPALVPPAAEIPQLPPIGQMLPPAEPAPAAKTDVIFSSASAAAPKAPAPAKAPMPTAERPVQGPAASPAEATAVASPPGESAAPQTQVASLDALLEDRQRQEESERMKRVARQVARGRRDIKLARERLLLEWLTVLLVTLVVAFVVTQFVVVNSLVPSESME